MRGGGREDDSYLIVVSVNERQFELVLGGVNVENSGPDLSIQTEYLAALDPSDVDRHV